VVSASKSGAWLPMLSNGVSITEVRNHTMNRCRRRRLAVAWILSGENLDSDARRPSTVD
jgi:hypothetical protein